MCNPAFIGAGMSAGGSLFGMFGDNESKKSQAAAQYQTQLNMIQEMNMNDQELSLSAVSARESVAQDLTNVNLANIRNKGSIKAAISEQGIEGNSVDRVERAVSMEATTAKAGLTDNYNRDYQKIFSERISNNENTKRAIAGMAPIEYNSMFDMTTALLTGGLSNFVGSNEFWGNAFSGFGTDIPTGAAGKAVTGKLKKMG